ncbi:hypothetical protein Syun_030754 [Stephania yunnanensis]|uniref:Uncharacterized protein n=1 Tax=Stephania yunnanensis TaxID=152371 RepID=A0AAP0E081_9MAGN
MFGNWETEWMKKAKRMMEERKMRRGSRTTASPESPRTHGFVRALMRCGEGEWGLRTRRVGGGTTVVVKRLKDVVVTKREFEKVEDALGENKREDSLVKKRRERSI